MIHRHWPWLGLVAILLAAWLAYAPGLAGGFLFDDFPNLEALNTPGPVDTWPAFWRYITSGSADPTGRPLALLSFLLDARAWPADPAPFLRTNVLLHLLNGALLFVLLRRLGRALGDATPRADAAALVGAGAWLLHPLFVSTTLYIIQREAMLPATFSLLGLIGYLHGRALLDGGRTHAGMAWMFAAIGGGTVLALLCKANGILLPLLAWTLEATVLGGHAPADAAAARRLRQLRRGLLVLPSLVVFAYVASFLPALGEHLDHRAWTIGQRLLTEPRALLEYLMLLVVPRVLSTGLYNDGFPVSTSLLQPASTLPAIVLVVGLVAGALMLRRRAPALAAALLFFFAGHLLESSAIPLELYFEHRNYLPAMLLFWPLGRVLFAAAQRPRARAGAAIALLLLLALITWQRAALWGDPQRMAQLWALQNPSSSRAQATTAAHDASAGRPALALQRLAPAWRQRPHDLQLALNYANAACAVRGLDPDDVARIASALRHAREGQTLVFHWLDRALDVASSGRCRGLDFAAIDRWLAAIGANPAMQTTGRVQDMEAIRGRIALLQQQPDAALAHFDRALEAYVTPDAAAMNTAMLASAGYYPQALAHLDHYARIEHRAVRVHDWTMPRLHQAVLDWQGYWPYELALLRSKLRAEIAAMPAPPQSTAPSR